MAKNLKYKLTKESILVDKKTLYRIKALKDFNYVSKGDLGGFIEKESNLNQEGDCWVYENAKVFDDAWVSGNAKIYGNAQVYNNAKVYGKARVYGNTRVFGNSLVYNYAQVFGNAQVYGDSVISGNAAIYHNAQVYGNAKVYGDTQIFGNAQVYGNSVISGNAAIYHNAKVFGNAQVSANSWIYDDSWPISPFYFCLSKHTITTISYAHIKIGCKIHKIEEWEELGEDIAKKYGYSDEDIKFYSEACLLAVKYIELVKKETDKCLKI